MVSPSATPPPSTEQVTAALATVNDPEIHRPITELGMVKSVDIAADGAVRVEVYLTVSGCPLRDTITRDVTAAVAAVPGVSGVRGRTRRDERGAAPRAADPAARRAAGAGDPVRPARPR